MVADKAEQQIVFGELDAAPVPSLLRGFSAPVILEGMDGAADLALLLRHDPDGFNRWQAGQQLAICAYEALREHGGGEAVEAWSDALAGLFAEDGVDPALLADLMTPPGEVELAEREREADPARIHAMRQQLQLRLAERIGAAAILVRFELLAAQTNDQLDALSQAQRRLKRRMLELLSLLDAPRAQALAAQQYEQAPGMTDRLAALSVLVRTGAPQAAAALVHFRQRYADNPLALDKWFSVQTQHPGEPALAAVQALERDAAFTLKNPNRVNALYGAWARGNPSGFHRADGAGYRLLAERLAGLDALNPQIAARLATVFNGWRRLEPVRRARAREAIAGLAQREGLSRNLGEIVQSMLHE